MPDEAILHTRLTSSGRLLFEVKNDDGDVELASPQSLADGRWHHVVASWGPSSIDLHIDGQLVARDARPREMDQGEFRGRFVRFGKPSSKQSDTFNPYKGWVDEIAVWDRPLSPVEVACQFDAALGTDE